MPRRGKSTRYVASGAGGATYRVRVFADYGCHGAFNPMSGVEQCRCAVALTHKGVTCQRCHCLLCAPWQRPGNPVPVRLSLLNLLLILFYFCEPVPFLTLRRLISRCFMSLGAGVFQVTGATCRACAIYRAEWTGRVSVFHRGPPRHSWLPEIRSIAIRRDCRSGFGARIGGSLAGNVFQ